MKNAVLNYIGKFNIYYFVLGVLSSNILCRGKFVE